MSDLQTSQQEGAPEAGSDPTGAQASAGEAALVPARSPRPPVAPWIVASIADLVGLGLVVGVQEMWTLFAAAGLHLAALLPIASMRALSSSEKALAMSFVFAFPVLGAPLALLALEHGNGDLASDLMQAPTAPPDTVAADFGRLAVALPSCEALTAGTIEERRAIIATLVRRGDADAVALLRWALGASDPDLAVDAALALEEMTASFDARLAACREALAAAQGPADTAAPTASPAPTLPAAEAALAAAELITHAIDVGVADPALVPALASEARDDYALAGTDSTQADAVAIGRTQLELGALRPDTALACIDAALPTAGPEIRPVLLSLREEALLASHALPWEGPSALASYQVRAHSHARRPPPLTARRRLGILPPPPLSGSIRVGPVQVPGAAATRKVRHVGRE
jgi:hypothetical protein